MGTDREKRQDVETTKEGLEAVSDSGDSTNPILENPSTESESENAGPPDPTESEPNATTLGEPSAAPESIPVHGKGEDMEPSGDEAFEPEEESSETETVEVEPSEAEPASSQTALTEIPKSDVEVSETESGGESAEAATSGTESSENGSSGVEAEVSEKDSTESEDAEVESSQVDSAKIETSEMESSEHQSSEEEASKTESIEGVTTGAEASETESIEEESSEVEASETELIEGVTTGAEASETESIEEESSEVEAEASETESIEEESSEVEAEVSETESGGESAEAATSGTESIENGSSGVEAEVSEKDSTESEDAEVESSQVDSAKIEASETESIEEESSEVEAEDSETESGGESGEAATSGTESIENESAGVEAEVSEKDSTESEADEVESSQVDSANVEASEMESSEDESSAEEEVFESESTAVKSTGDEASETESIEEESSEVEAKVPETESTEVGSTKDDPAVHSIDLAQLNQTELTELVEKLAQSGDPQASFKIASSAKDVFDKKLNELKEKHLKTFLQEGGEEDDFEFRADEEVIRFQASFRLLRDRRHQFRKNQERSREENLEIKADLLEKLRHLVDGEETNASMRALKEIQSEWKNSGPVPSAQVKTLWANYNALITRFYDNRSIYFELKELDRKKNLEAKNQLCERAEALGNIESLREAVKELNELHEEFKHLGPVPMDRQEEVWTRFKSSSDKVYARRKDHYDGLKKEFAKNLTAKEDLILRLEEFKEFNSERISEWNSKTKGILDLQKEWEAVGGLPREKAKEINKRFWASFKKFFSNKSHFFKQLEGQRQGNLELKQDLVRKAEEVKDSTEWEQTAEFLKQLQNQWREIGPVPDKIKDQIYKQFKAACDSFFDNKRGHRKDTEKEFEDNLKEKEALCSGLEDLAKRKDVSEDQLPEYLEKWGKIGFVPRNAIKKIQLRFDDAMDKVIAATPGLNPNQILDLKLSLKLRKLKNGPNAQNKLFKRELSVKKQIEKLEGDLSAWQTNLEYFADSKNAEILKQDFNQKIDQANQELSELKKELKILYKI